MRVGEGELLATVSNLVALPRGLALSAEATSLSCSSNLQRVSAGEMPDLHEQILVDVRGKTADEALDQVIAALDRAALSEAPVLRIIHGHGTGRLKSVLRGYLKDSPYVKEFRLGDRAEGGDGVTIAKLR